MMSQALSKKKGAVGKVSICGPSESQSMIIEHGLSPSSSGYQLLIMVTILRVPLSSCMLCLLSLPYFLFSFSSFIQTEITAPLLYGYCLERIQQLLYLDS